MLAFFFFTAFRKRTKEGLTQGSLIVSVEQRPERGELTRAQKGMGLGEELDQHRKVLLHLVLLFRDWDGRLFSFKPNVQQTVQKPPKQRKEKKRKEKVKRIRISLVRIE